VSPHPASPELLEDVDELLVVLVDEALAAAPPVPPLVVELAVVEVVEEELVAGAPPVPPLVVELADVAPPLPPVRADWTVLPQDEGAAASARSDEPTTIARVERAIFEMMGFMGADPHCRGALKARRASPTGGQPASQECGAARTGERGRRVVHRACAPGVLPGGLHNPQRRRQNLLSSRTAC